MRLDPNDYLMVHRSHLSLKGRQTQAEGVVEFMLSIETNVVFEANSADFAETGDLPDAMVADVLSQYGKALFMPKLEEGVTPEEPVEESLIVTP